MLSVIAFAISYLPSYRTACLLLGLTRAAGSITVVINNDDK